MTVAVLDLGTNVFHLLLAEISEKGVRVIKEFKCAAKIGAGGLSNGYIAPIAFETASAAMQQIMQQINENGGADTIIPYATSAVRDAKNGLEFAEYMNRKFGIKINIIPGEKEAEFVFKGIMGSVPYLRDKDGYFANSENVLMLDIGGGSNEFIISNGVDILWKRSFPIGMARMREKFNYREPIEDSVIKEFEDFNEEVLQPLWEQVDKYKPSLFIGSSGSFDTFKDLIYNCRFREQASIELKISDLDDLKKMLLPTTTQQRLQMPGMSPIRADYIVLASIFTMQVINRVKPRIVYQSSYSLKEGAMSEVYENYLKNIK